MVREGTLEFLYRIGTNEAVPRKVEPEPVSDYQGISPRAEFWITALGTVSKIVAHSTQGEPAVQICTFCGIWLGTERQIFLSEIPRHWRDGRRKNFGIRAKAWQRTSCATTIRPEIRRRHEGTEGGCRI